MESCDRIWQESIQGIILEQMYNEGAEKHTTDSFTVYIYHSASIGESTDPDISRFLTLDGTTDIPLIARLVRILLFPRAPRSSPLPHLLLSMTMLAKF